MGLFSKKITFRQSCEYSFNTWEKHYLPNEEKYTADAIAAAGLTGKISLTQKGLDFLWTELEFLYDYLLIIYGFYYFKGKHSAKDVSQVVADRYLNYLLMGLRGESEAEAIKTRDDLVEFVEAAEAKTSLVKNRAALDAHSMATFGLMTTAERLKAHSPDFNDEVFKYLAQRVWAAAEAPYGTYIKIIWE